MKQIAITTTCGFALALTAALAPMVMLRQWDLEARQNQHRIEARRLEEQAQQRALEQQRLVEARRLEEQQQQRVLEHQQRLARRLEEQQQQLALEQQRLIEARRLEEHQQKVALELSRLEEQQRALEQPRQQGQQCETDQLLDSLVLRDIGASPCAGRITPPQLLWQQPELDMIPTPANPIPRDEQPAQLDLPPLPPMPPPLHHFRPDPLLDDGDVASPENAIAPRAGHDQD